MKLPKLSDDAALFKFVGEVIEDDHAEQAAREYNESHLYEEPPRRMSEVLASMEREAIEAAEDGNFKPLGDMLVNPFFKNFNGVLSPKAQALIAAKLRDEVKSRKGPKRKPSWQRELKPERDAAGEVYKIVAILNRHYPKEKGHRERAITIAAKRAGIRRQAVVTELGSRHRRRST